MKIYFDFVGYICSIFLLIHLLMIYKSLFNLEITSLLFLDYA